MNVAAQTCWCCNGKTIILFTLALEDDLKPAVSKCAGCGTIFLNPQPTDGQLLPYYDTSYYGLSTKKFIGPIARFVRWWQAQRAANIARRIAPPARVLDVGCGNGQFLLDLHNAGFDVQGTELTSQSASRVPSPLKDKIHIGDLLTLNLQAQHYDAISLWHVLEHVRAPAAVCKEVHRILKPGGWLFLSLPNAQSPEAKLFARHWFHLDPPRHLFGFGTRSLPELLKANGFEVKTLNTWSLEQNPYGFMQSCLNALGIERDRAYNTLKGMHKGRVLANIIDLVMLAILLIPAMLWSSLFSCIGKGSTMTIVARKL